MAIGNELTETALNNAIDLVVTMVADELSNELHQSPAELLPRFIASRTGRLLYDETSKLWWTGPSNIAKMSKGEITESG